MSEKEKQSSMKSKKPREYLRNNSKIRKSKEVLEYCEWTKRQERDMGSKCPR